MLCEGLAALLGANSGVIGFIGTPDSRKQKTKGKDATPGIFASRAFDDALDPYIVHHQVSGDTLETLEGTNAFQSARIEFSCYSRNFITAKRLAAAVKNALLGLRATLPDGTEVDSVHLASEIDFDEFAPMLFRVAVDFEFTFRDVGSQS